MKLFPRAPRSKDTDPTEAIDKQGVNEGATDRATDHANDPARAVIEALRAAEASQSSELARREGKTDGPLELTTEAPGDSLSRRIAANEETQPTRHGHPMRTAIRPAENDPRVGQPGRAAADASPGGPAGQATDTPLELTTPADPAPTSRPDQPSKQSIRKVQPSRTPKTMPLQSGAQTINFPSREDDPELAAAFDTPSGPRLSSDGSSLPGGKQPSPAQNHPASSTSGRRAAPKEGVAPGDRMAALRANPSSGEAQPQSGVVVHKNRATSTSQDGEAKVRRKATAEPSKSRGAKAPKKAKSEQIVLEDRPANTEQAPDANDDEWGVTPGAEARDDALLDCLVIMTAIFERPHSAEALSAGLPLIDGQITPELFVRAAGRAGMSARIVKRKLNDIANLSLPAVLLLENGKACVLVKQRADGKASIVLPETGHGVTDIPIAKLTEMYVGYVIFAKPEFQFDKRSEATEIKATKSWFWGTLRKFWPIYTQVGIAALLINLFALASPLFVMNVYDRVVPTKGQETLWVLVVGVLTIFIFEFLLRFLRSYFTDTAGRSADVIMSSMIFQQILGIRMAARPPSAGAFANQLREFETLREFFTSATIVTLIDLPFILLFITIIFMIGGPIGFVPLVAVPIIAGAGFLMQAPLTKIVTASSRESAQKHALLVESIVGLETIKSMGAEGRTQRNWEQFVGKTAKSSTDARKWSQLAMYITTLVTQLTTVATVVVGVYLIFDGALTVGALIACTILTGRAMAPLGQVAALLTRFNQSMVSLRTLDNIMNMPVERPEGAHFVHRPKLAGSIEFKDVTFAYPQQQINALEGVSFAVKAGEKIGIIGKIGSGKTTIEKLGLGLYQPDAGSIRVDGTDLQQIDPADLRRNIGYVSQDIFLFFGTVRENIATGAPHADDAAILRAARISGVDNFVSKHPAGFDLNVGERGESLSGGQRQSIAIARALVRDPNILILDEPTSAMDKGSEDWFIARLREYVAAKTLIVVTQRVSLLTLVDRLIVMDGGRVVADGPRDSVLENLARGQIQSGVN